MAEREWISQEKMFWTKDEWDEAYANQSKKPGFEQLSGIDRISKLIAYLMHEYPVPMSQLKAVKKKYA